MRRPSLQSDLWRSADKGLDAALLHEARLVEVDGLLDDVELHEAVPAWAGTDVSPSLNRLNRQIIKMSSADAHRYFFRDDTIHSFQKEFRDGAIVGSRTKEWIE